MEWVPAGKSSPNFIASSRSCRSVSCSPTVRQGSRRVKVPAGRILARLTEEAAMRVLVTGAASGIGRATCLRLARDARARGGKASIAAVDLVASSALDAVAEEMQVLGTQTLTLHGHMGTLDAPARVVEEAAGRFGGLDGLVSNAGI